MIYLEVGFTRETRPDIVSKAIMRFLKTKYSHVFIIYKDTIYHSTGKGVNKLPLADYLKDHILEKKYSIVSHQTSGEFEAFMDGCEGKDYGESQYLGFLSPHLQSFVKNGAAKTICSELVADYLVKYCGYKTTKCHDFMSPLDCEELLNNCDI